MADDNDNESIESGELSFEDELEFKDDSNSDQEIEIPEVLQQLQEPLKGEKSSDF